MNAKELLEYFDLHARREWSAASHETILRALRLLAAAEANDGNCPETEAAMCRYTGGEPVTFPKGLSAVVPYSFAANLERERNGLAARVGELEKDAERYRWLRDECGNTESADGIGFISRSIHWESFGKSAREKTFDAAIDAARSK